MPADYSRPMLKPVYPTVSDYYKNIGQIEYAAHLILTDDRAVAIGRPVESSASGGATNHPDQKFWRESAKSLTDVLARFTTPKATAALIARVEIDCTLLPCEGTNGCTTTVPALMKNLGYDGLKVRVFSHRSEMAPRAGVLPARYYDFTVGSRNEVLGSARADTGGWSWKP
jgi:hypothetical protein